MAVSFSVSVLSHGPLAFIVSEKSNQLLILLFISCIGFVTSILLLSKLFSFDHSCLSVTFELSVIEFDEFFECVNKYFSLNWDIFGHYFFNYILCFSFLLSGTSIMCILVCLQCPNGFWDCSFLNFFSYVCSWDSVQFTSVQLLSRVQLFVTAWTTVGQAFLSITNSWSLLKLVSISQWCHPTISSSVVPSPPVFNLSQNQDLFKWVSSLHQVVRVLEF